MSTHVSITQIVRSIEVSITDAGGRITTIITADRPANVPWSAITSKPDNLCLMTVDDDQLFVEFRDLAGNLITKVPYIPE